MVTSLRADCRARALIAQRCHARRGGGSPGATERSPSAEPGFTAVRVTPAHDWRQWPSCATRSGCCARKRRDAQRRLKYYFVNLPSSAFAAARLVRLTHQRWAIEQQYQELKTELGLDHFEGRTMARLAASRGPDGRRACATSSASACAAVPPDLTFPAVRAIVQEIFTALLVCGRNRATCIGWNRRNAKLQLRI